MDIHDLFDFSRWTFLAGTLPLVLGLGFFIQGCAKTRTTEEEKTMVTAKADSMPNREIPPIDRSRSLRTETATFALG
jgi:hypothetical protein